MSEQQGAGFYRFTIGEFKAATVSDGFIIFDDPKVLFAGDVDDTEYRSLLTSRFLSPQSAYTQINALFVDTGKNKVLIDNGTGPHFGPSAGHLPESLRNMGISPEEIDTVVISHAHVDHIGASITPDGAQVFPKAQYVVGEKEWEFWNQSDVQLGQPYPDGLKQMVIDVAKRQLGGIKDRVKFVKPGDEIIDGITAVEAFGHSAGMLAMNIASGRETALYTADSFMHYAISIEHPEWEVGLDNDRTQAAAARRRILDRVTAEKSLVLVPHFPFPGVGHVSKQGVSHRWEPVVWRW